MALRRHLALAVLVGGQPTATTQGQVNVPTSDVLNRVMQIHYPTSPESGTAFTIEIDKRQYLITARHLVQGIKQQDQVELKKSTNWVTVPVTVINTDTNADIAVLVLPAQITTAYPVSPTFEHSVIGQDVYFLGYPYGLYIPTQGGFNVAFEKKAIISSAITDSNGIPYIFLDGHNNPGFSGGPIAFKNVRDGHWHIGGVVIGYRWEPNGIVNSTDTTAFVKENTGIVVGVSIDVAVKAIKAHPIGPPITY
jgi:S1-C subfamily serine protease